MSNQQKKLKMPIKQIAAGIITCDHKILIAQRKRGKDLAFFWELPGGKLEAGETLQECLKREMIEEMDLEITVGDLFMSNVYDYEFGRFQINAFWASCESQLIPKICEHEQYKWVTPKQALDYKFSPADVPIIEKLAQTGIL